MAILLNKEEFKLEQNVEVGGMKSSLGGKIVFDSQKGTAKITVNITTKQMSFNDSERAGFMRILNQQIEQAYDQALSKIEQFFQGQRPEGNLFSALKEIGGEDEESEEPKQEKASRRKKSTAHADAPGGVPMEV